MRASIRPLRLTNAGQISTCQITTPRFMKLRTFYSSRLSSPTLVPPPRLSRQGPWHSAIFARYNTTLTAPSSFSSSPQTSASSSPTATQPAYEIYFTCKPCSQRSGPHRVTKQGFHKGTTLITCPSCKNRHVVSDHLRIFTDQGGDLVDIMRRHGEKLKKGKLGIRDGQLVGNEGEEEIEFWEDGTETPHLSQEPKSQK
jgi:mitochondrial protein import protein ZIM17